jgi:6-phosphogluconolactonase
MPHRRQCRHAANGDPVRRPVFLALFVLAIGLGASAGRARALTPAGKPVLYASVGNSLTRYEVKVADAALAAKEAIALPEAVQYVWTAPSKKFLYVAWSNGMEGTHAGVSAFRIDPATGALTPHGQPMKLAHRPVHLTVDPPATHVLVAYNSPSAVTVHELRPDGTLGGEVKQPAALDGGIYAHQVRVDPAGKMAILVTRGNAAGAKTPEDPGGLKVFGYNNGVLTNRLSIAPNRGYGFQSRNLDFHPTGPWLYVALEVQSKLAVFRRINNNESVDPTPLFVKDTVQDPSHLHHPAQQAGPVFVHPNGRFVYTTNRTNGTIDEGGKRIFEGGENTVAVFSINEQTGEPTLIQSIDTHGFHARTFSFDDAARILVAANQTPVTVRQNGVDTLVPACLSVYRMRADGKLEYARKYDVQTGGGDSLMWSGMITLP